MGPDVLRPNRAAMVLGRPAGDGKPETVARPGRLVGATDERLEDLFRLFFGNPRPFVLD